MLLLFIVQEPLGRRLLLRQFLLGLGHEARNDLVDLDLLLFALRQRFDLARAECMSARLHFSQGLVGRLNLFLAARVIEVRREFVELHRHLPEQDELHRGLLQ